MATLNFNGKSIIWNHHLSIPYHTLEKDKKLSYNDDKANGNLLIEGDNLLALKSLLPKYTGKIKCIYIDPPYNTGNEGWVYNDNVNSPRIKEWLNKEVGKDDLARHDKWLCMMTPRLRMLRELLSDDGVIFVSIEDNEVHHLRALMDGIFGEVNYIGEFIWKNKLGGGNDSNVLVSEHEYITVYAKDAEKCQRFTEPNVDNGKYLYEDEYIKTRGKYSREALYRSSIRYSDSLFYPIETPDGTSIYPNESDKTSGKHIWRWSRQTFEKKLNEGRVEFKKTSNGWRVFSKQYFLEDDDGNLRTLSVRSIIDFIGNRQGTELLKGLFDKDKVFDNPKPVELIKYLITILGGKDFIVLDSFAGSGTTAQAVLELNEEDQGSRKFILVQMTESTEKEPNKNICKDITRERIKRVIEKKLTNKEVGFEYLKVGIPIDSETILSGQLPSYSELAKYVYYLATGEAPSDKVKIEQKKSFIGSFGDKFIYLIYKQDFDALKTMALDLEFAEKIYKENPKGEKIIYAPSCFLDDEHLDDFNIKFVSIPYNLFERE